ncbi:MAG: DUF4810 domain-containing protein [Roseateles sp.]|uniref:DUF4810 domain-containing protein n=1 Tax=Roseateles sp. TaxID=1971397 RepID=UPI0039E89DCD
MTKTSLALCALVVLAGCAQTAPKPLYQWAGYQEAVYQYLKTNGGEPGAQIAALEAQVDKNKAAGELNPPGLRAHLALLYAKSGDDVAAHRHLEAERAQFPEAAAYVDFLLRTAKQGAGTGAAGSAPAPAPSASPSKT